jgi:adenine-specific DNA-methyltransferase
MMRDYFKRHKLLRAIIDMEHYDVFENFSVYTMITYLDKKHQSDDFTYNRFNEESMTVDKVDVLNINDVDINGEFYFSPHEDLKLLTDVKTHSYDKVFYVKNGIATLLDKVFINNNLPFDDYTTQMLKASTGTWSKCFFPYDKFGNPLPSSEIQQNNTIMSYLLENQEALLKRKCDTGIEDWFYYGRSQGLRDTFRQRLAINSIIKDIDSMKFNIVPEGCSVYSGLYIYSETEDISIARQHLETEEFIRYVKSLKKYKSGGFYTFSSKDVETYLNYKITTNI